MERPCTGLVFLQARLGLFLLPSLPLGYGKILAVERCFRFLLGCLFGRKREKKKKRKSGKRNGVHRLWTNVENLRKSRDKAEEQPRKNRLGCKRKTTWKLDWKQNRFPYFRFIWEEKKKKKRKSGMWEKREKRGRKCGANRLLSGGPIADRVEQVEDKKDCLFEDNLICPVTLDKVTVEM